MKDPRKLSDEEWKKMLTPPQYAMLRHGEMEPPSASDIEVPKRGVFVCIGCGAELFSPDDRGDDGSGYVCFRRALRPDAVLEESHYTAEGTPVVVVKCTVCGSIVGRVGDMEIRSDDDLESGTSERIYHTSVHAVAHQSARNGRSWSITRVMLMLMFLLVLGGAAFFFTHALDIWRRGGVADVVPLWVREQQVLASTYVAPIKGDVVLNSKLFKDEQALFVVLPVSGERTILCESLTQGAALTWLDSDRKVLSSIRYEYAHQRIMTPVSTKYILVQSGESGTVPFPDPNSTVLMTDKARSF